MIKRHLSGRKFCFLWFGVLGEDVVFCYHLYACQIWNYWMISSHQMKLGENPSSGSWEADRQPLKLDSSLPKSDTGIDGASCKEISIPLQWWLRETTELRLLQLRKTPWDSTLHYDTWKQVSMHNLGIQSLFIVGKNPRLDSTSDSIPFQLFKAYFTVYRDV